MLRNGQLTQIPVFDLKKLQGNTIWKSEHKEIWKDVAASFCHSLSTMGFIYLTGHGIPSHKIKSALESSKAFFELPDDTKDKYSKVNPLIDMHGYSKPGQEKLGKNAQDDLREFFDFWDWKERTMPEELLHFTNTNQQLKEECKKLTKTLLQLIAIHLDLSDVNHFIKCHSGLSTNTEESIDSYSRNLYRSQYYPPLNEDAFFPESSVSRSEDILRCPEHTDFGTITLLFQDDNSGLQIRNELKEWIDVPPIPNSILINTGDLLEIWSSGKFTAAPHRVIVPSGSNTLECRQSIVYFVNPDDSTTISPLINNTNCTQKYDATTPGEHYSRRIQESYT